MDVKIINIRALAAFMVVLLHCTSQEFYTFSDNWSVYATLGAFARPCVPLFLMITGYLMLNKEYDIFDFLRKRLLRVAIPLCFWGMSYVVFVSVFGNGPLNPISFLKVIYSPPMFHLWYLYVIIGLYIMMPILSRWSCKASIAEKFFYISIWIVVLFLSQTLIGNLIVQQYYLGLFGSYLFFFISGGLLKDISSIFNKKNMTLFFLLYSIFSILIAYLTINESYGGGIPSEKFFVYTHPLVVLQSIFLFCFMLGFKKTNKFINSISENSLGIYCVHVAIIIITYQNIKNIFDQWLVTLISSIVITFFSSWFFIKLVRKLKFFDRVL
ncbi:acyltransferase family protein [Xenorhabdus sp. SF857]|uniref:acyltransferase n=1 Tax=Xenorhabdus bakwenae TaxID=3026967 RepID=UPI002557F1AC|nr:acyltransferase family protein [Xenorhabdus sp. SF857]WFQ80103.1 acyltransferase family protein [Xenorhabdus sp. SF857]